MRIGLDIGSTTLKCVVLDDAGAIRYSSYQRHFSKITENAGRMLAEIRAALPEEAEMEMSVSGSAGMGFAERLGLPFEQEVYATRRAVRGLLPGTDVVIELGGEDAKILFLTGGLEVRMNGSCAGGTGAFIDQMAALLNTTPTGLDELAARHEKLYSIASRCGVFAKSDIQPLLNQGARREDVSASIFAAVVSQTIAGLAQGRSIGGNVVYLGGPLTFLPQLRRQFDDALGLTGLCPENSLYYVALGAAMAEGKRVSLDELAGHIGDGARGEGYNGCRPLFADRQEYEQFALRHSRAEWPEGALLSNKEAYLGIDAGSTTVKAVALNARDEILFSRYMPNTGNPIPLIKGFLEELYEAHPDIRIRGAASTGYGEEIVKNAFHLDFGLVETMAHYEAAQRLDPNVDFIIDIGGQDIKCFKIRNGTIDNIFLNEACSSGCGSFLQTFAQALGYSVQDFAKEGLFADKPVDLGSRCTVFMNSSVKQAQKDGASVQNISAGLSISVVKNALYKVIRAGSPDALGQHIVVQGGTFMNDAVLRAFEQELDLQVTRPVQAGLMGALGAALYAKENCGEVSSILNAEQLAGFTHKVAATTCQGCTNHCRLTVNTFADGSRFIGGNQCEKPLGGKKTGETYNLYTYKRELLAAYASFEGRRETIGIPLGLNMLELLPFWHTFFKELGFGVRLSPPSSRELYREGQGSIPSDTVCYPAKLMHGHVQALVDAGVDAVFYPCLTYNVDEGLGDNHFNCPVVAYYPEVIRDNMDSVKNVRYIYDYLGIHRPKDFAKKAWAMLDREFGGVKQAEVRRAADAAYAEYSRHMERVHAKGQEYLAIARERGLPVIVLAGRPYHLDEQINHGIDKYVVAQGAVVVSEDSLGDEYTKEPVNVLNQWTYHSRLYAAARYVAQCRDLNINLVQLVSFGCGLDAVTTDEVRAILEAHGKIYTQIKIDDITNLGAVKIRLRSLFAAAARKGGVPDGRSHKARGVYKGHEKNPQTAVPQHV